MFSLIISIISIALVAALAAATVYFGGAAFNKGGAGADASAFINAGQQIAGAFTLAEVEADSTVSAVADLAPNYLAQEPTYKGANFVLSTDDAATLTIDEADYVQLVVKTDDICTEINKRANGVDGSGNVVAVTAVDGLYGCVTSTKSAFYKVK